MRVMVTGGTGFVGSHTVAALVEHGHEVDLLVRSPGKVARALEPLGRAGDLLARLTPVEPVIDYETAHYMSYLSPTDDGAVEDQLGVRWRPPEDSVEAMLEWLVDAGHFDPAKAGKVAHRTETV